MIAGAAAKSPAAVVALDMAPSKLAPAMKCGATHTVNIAEQDPAALVKDLTGVEALGEGLLRTCSSGLQQ